MKSLLIRKDPDAGKNWRQEKGTIKDEMFGWHHELNGVFTAMIYHSERIQSKSSKEKRHMGQRPEETRPGFQGSAAIGVSHNALKSSSHKLGQHMWDAAHQRSWLRLVTRSFSGSWSCRHTLPSTYQNSRALEEKQVFGIATLLAQFRHNGPLS